MRILLRELLSATRRTTLLDLAVPAGETVRADGLNLNESSRLAFLVYPDEGPSVQVRLRVGNFLVASTLPRDRADFLLREPDDLPDGAPHFLACSGFLLRDWVGQTDLVIEVQQAGHWRRAVHVAPLFIAAGKLEQAAFEALCREIADHSAAALLDVYGKTFVGLEAGPRRGGAGPVAELERVRQTIHRLAAALRDIARQPAYRLKARRVREPALAGQAVSDLTLEEACVDPTLAVAHRRGVAFREQVREVASPHFNLAEHRTLAGFIDFVGRQLGDLGGRLHREVKLREERRAYRHRRDVDGEKSWWEMEDLPRIDELNRLLASVATLDRELTGLWRFSFLARGALLRAEPAATPLFRARRAYAEAYQTMVSHFRTYRVRVDEEHLLTRAKSLPVLYEWWCVLQVMRGLQGALRLREQPGTGSPFQCLREDRDTFVVEFASDQRVDFVDMAGRLVRLRYQPSYRSRRESHGAGYGWLGREHERTPDVAIEIYGADATLPPELVIVFDAKYSSVPHAEKLREVKDKYDRIGVHRTGRVLSRQVWALTPAAPAYPGAALPDCAPFCTVDNEGFWSDDFDMASSVAGAIQTKPLLMEGRSPLEILLRLLLGRAGLQLRA